MWKQFGIYVCDAVQGDLGTSIRTREPVLQRSPATSPPRWNWPRWPPSSACWSACLRACWPPPGPASFADQIVRLVGLMGYSMPVFWLGLMGLLVFYGQLGWVGGPGRLDAAYRDDDGVRR